MPNKAKTLWQVEVDHEFVPGTIAFLVYDANEPTLQAVADRLPKGVRVKECSVSGVFDLSHTLKQDRESRRALAQFIADGGMNTLSTGADS